MSTLSLLWKRGRLPILLVGMFLGAFLFGSMIPMPVKSFFYAVSLTIKVVLFASLPFVIFSFLFYSVLRLREGALLFVVLLLTMAYMSNFTAIFTALGASHFALPWMHFPAEEGGSNPLGILQPLWTMPMIQWVKNEYALSTGLSLGLIFSLWPQPNVTRLADRLNTMAVFLLRRFFVPILPLFIAGFILKIEHEGMLAKVVVVYGSVLGVVVTIQAIYLGLYYFLAARFDLTRWVSMLRQVAPAAIAGFSTMSSASAMPISMIAAEKNTGDPAMARAIVPASVNIHTLGSALALTILAMTTLKTFGMELPSLELAIRFSAYYALAKFAVAAVPGGAVLVAAPLLESFFGFTPDMTAIFTAVYTFFDPFSTAGNVLGNGAFAVLFNDTFKFFRRTPEEKKAVEA